MAAATRGQRQAASKLALATRYGRADVAEQARHELAIARRDGLIDAVEAVAEALTSEQIDRLGAMVSGRRDAADEELPAAA